MPIFTNRENERITLPDGRVIFLARSTAVVGCVLCLQGDDISVLMVERGEQVDNSGKWCMPCGYLDWDEDFIAAVKRELFEETGLDLDAEAVRKKLVFEALDHPYYVESSPKSHRQNISNHFGIVLQGPPPVLPRSAGLNSGEITSVEWVRLSAIPTSDKLEASGLKDHFAFDHNDKVHRFVNAYKRAGYESLVTEVKIN